VTKLSDKSKILTPSTAEAIRMASASILGTTTRQGYPLGSAIGSGSMMEQNSESVAMNVTPLIFAISEALRDSEGLELLSIEWDLDHVPGPEVLPEQLVVSGGSIGGVNSHVSVLSWERGVVDPFKIDSHIKSLAKKIADVELAVTNNQLDYDTDGFRVLKRFSDRLNSVIFVDMIDRRFQGSWDSFQLKHDQVDEEFRVRLNTQKDFTTLPPGPKIQKISDISFTEVQSEESNKILHFNHRILTPGGLDIIARKIPEAGRAILNELNAFAYGIEEVDIARITIEFLEEFLGTNCISVNDLPSVSTKSEEFSDILSQAVSACETVLEGHITSGKTLDLEEHHKHILGGLDQLDLDGFVKRLVSSLVSQSIKALEREFPTDIQIRAWQLKSTLRYYVAYSQRVSQYFVKEFNQYLIIAAARKSFIAALNEFKSGVQDEGWDPTDVMLFDKFYDELFLQLNAIFDKTAYKGLKQKTTDELNRIIASEMVGIFKLIDMWDIVNFGDVAKIARDEISKRYESDEGIDTIGQSLLHILDSLERLVFEIVPDLSDFLLSKKLISRILESQDISTTTRQFIGQSEKPDDWKREGLSWCDEFIDQIDSGLPLSKQLMNYLSFIHEKIGKGLTARLVVDRVVEVADYLENEYNLQVSKCVDLCNQIDEENNTIRIHNQKRNDLLIQTEDHYNNDMKAYEAALAEYEQKKLHASTSEIPIELPPIPTKPLPLAELKEKVMAEYPSKEEKDKPPKPEPSLDHLRYSELRELLTEKLARMDENQESMENTFSEQLKRLQTGEYSVEGSLQVDIGAEFQEYLLNSVMRLLGRLYPKVTRVYMRNPAIENLLYLVTYEHSDDEIIVRVGDNFLR